MEQRADQNVYLNSIRTLSDILAKYYEKNVIILIDEYDVPLENAYHEGFYDDMTNLIRSCFESALKTNPSLEFAVLTGCLRVSRESIFTGLNNLKTYSITKNKFSQYFGFTQEEMQEILQNFSLEQYAETIAKWYDGYRFGLTEIYNPWSVLNCIDSYLQNDMVADLAICQLQHTMQDQNALPLFRQTGKGSGHQFVPDMQGVAIDRE